jgi:hypothetical protein
MKKATSFSDVLDAAGKFPVDEMEEISEILHKRAVEIRRKDLARDIKSARAEFKSGRVKKSSAQNIMNELAL